MSTQLLDRRTFNRLGMAAGLSLPTAGAMAAALASASAHTVIAEAAASTAARAIKFPDGRVVPALGQGSGHLGLGRHPQAVEEEALRTGLSLGMTLIDTSDNYAEGRAEKLIGRVIAGRRSSVFLVSKVTSEHPTDDVIGRACAGSLSRLGTDYLDLYLLHYRARDADLSIVVTAFEALHQAGKIRAWGVSNFDVRDMEDLFRIRRGDRCATNQVLYNVGHRAIEHDLLPWCRRRGVPVMAYSPLGDGTLVHNAMLARIGAAHNCAPSAVALAWVIRDDHVIAIPEAGSPAHVKENAVALSLQLTPQQQQTLDGAFPPRDAG